MNQVSSNLTLFYRLFIPVFFVVFCGCMTVFLWAKPQQYYGNLDGSHLRIGFTVFFITSLTLMFFTIWKLKRVEMSNQWVYITDYFKQARYPWTNIKDISEHSFLFFKIVKVKLNEPGSFGNNITFVASKSKWEIFKKEHSTLFEGFN